MSVPKFSVEVLDAILLPNTNESTDKRKEAELLFESIPIIGRLQGLLQILVQLQSNNVANDIVNNADIGRFNLAAVLLRKDISRLAGEAIKNNASEINSVLFSMVDPLLTLYTTNSSNGNTGIIDRQSIRALSYCIAEVCLSLSLVATNIDAANVIKNILSRIGPTCSSGDATSLNLLSNIASRAPVALWASITMGDKQAGQMAMGNLLVSALAAIQNLQNTGQSYSESLEFLVEAVFQIGIASTVAENAAQSGDSSAVAEVSNAIYSQIQTPGKVTYPPIIPDSFSSQLGQTCLTPLLSLILIHPNNDLCRRCTQHLTDCATRAPSLLAGSTSTLQALILACIHMARLTNNEELDTETRLSALEVLDTMVENAEVKKILFMTENSELLNTLLYGKKCISDDSDTGLIGLCIQVIVDGIDEDIKQWAKEKPSLQENVVWDDDDDAIFAESLLERFIHAVGGTQTNPIIFPIIESLVQSPMWQRQRAALVALEKCLNASPTTFVPHIPVAIQSAVFLSHSDNVNVRVEWQCAQLLGALCIDHVEMVQKRFSEKILGSIARLISKNSCRKVVSHACLALVSFCRGSDKASSDEEMGAILRPYLKDVLMALASGPLAQNFSSPQALSPHNTVLIRAIGAVACLAVAVGEEFASFYNDFMPGLIACAGIGLELKGNVFEKAGVGQGDIASEEEMAELRGAAVEAASIIGQAIGSDNCELFTPDAEKIMILALPILSVANNEGNQVSLIPFDQLLSACARIASVMTSRFTPFLPTVIPHLLTRAAQEVNVSVSEGNEAGLEATRTRMFEHDDIKGTESVTVSVPGMGLKKLTLNTTRMQEKAQAARAVYELASAIGSDFWIYTQECAKVFLPLIRFKYSVEVRFTSAQALVPIFTAACEEASNDDSSNHKIKPFLQHLLPEMCKSILTELQNEEEIDLEALLTFADSLCDVLYCSYDNRQKDGQRLITLTTNESNEIVHGIIVVIKSCLKRRSGHFKKMNNVSSALNQDEQYDIEQVLEEEQNLLTHLVDSIGYILKSLELAFVDTFDSLVAPSFQPLLTATGTNDIRARLAAVCLFDDFVEHCGKAGAAKHAPALLQGVLDGLDDTKNQSDKDLKQASIYGVAQIVRYAPPTTLAKVVIPLTQVLQQTIIEDDDPNVLENAISAIASMVLFVDSPFVNTPGIDRSTITQFFIRALPLEQDYDEAKICHEGLCSMILAGSIDISSRDRIQEIINIFGECLYMVSNGEDIVDASTCENFGMILNKIRDGVGEATMNNILNSVEPKLLASLQAVM